jgi:succinyl-diaminopimelate desuccinylase
MASPPAIDAVGLARDLIRRPSVTPQDAGALDIVAQAAESLGFACERLVFSAPGTADIANLYARWGKRGRNLCFAGHTDVVPVGDAAAWRHDPFAGALTEGILHGRGAVDMKGAIAAFVTAAGRFLARRGAGLDGSISLLITGDEEAVSINGTAKVVDWLEARGERLDSCLVGEPTNAAVLGDTIKIGRRGSMTGLLTVHGTQGHTAYPHLADNPVHRLVAMLHALTAAPLDEATEHFQPSSLQLSTVDVGNPARNVIPAKAEAAFNIRFNDRWTSETLKASIAGRLAPFGGRYDLAFQVSGECFLTPPGEFANLVAAAVERVTGRRPELGTSGGTSDARFIRRLCPTAEFGLVGQTMHKVDEQVATVEIEALSRIYETLLDLYFPA